MLQPMPIRDYLAGLLVAVAESIRELPPSGCDRETAHWILDRLTPYCGDQCWRCVITTATTYGTARAGSATGASSADVLRPALTTRLDRLGKGGAGNVRLVRHSV
jgi:hypothetical protein